LANKEVGEVEVIIGGEAFTLRPSFRGLVEIEDKAGRGLLEIAKDISEGRANLKDIVAIIYGGVYGALDAGQKMPVTYDDLGERILKHGYPQLVTPAILFFGNGLKGRQEKKTEPA
jgi:hypothetical protein